jgi:hypothetical protein
MERACSVFLSINIGNELVEEHSDNDIEEKQIPNQPAHKEECNTGIVITVPASLCSKISKATLRSPVATWL